MTSASDLRKRKQAVDFATASSDLSGFKPTEDMKHLSQRYTSGEIDLDKFLSLALPEILPIPTEPESAETVLPSALNLSCSDVEMGKVSRARNWDFP